MRRRFLPALLVSVFAVCSCSININQSSVDGPQPNSRVPWGDLGLSGRLVYNNGTIEADRIATSVRSLDLVSGKASTIFRAPPGGWVDGVTVSPDTTLVVMSYSSPINKSSQLALYRMPMDASQDPQALFPAPTARDQYAQPYWSPDGKLIYFAHINYDLAPNYVIMRLAYPDGEPEVLVENAYWPRLSDDGTRLVYVAVDSEDGTNMLFVSKPDGTDARQVPVRDLPIPSIIDAPMFSPDNQTILFSSPVGIPASGPNLFDKAMGVIVASADGTIPSDWWTVPAAGGKAERITRIRSLGLYGWFSPDKKFVASYSSDGIFVMRPDGTEVTMIVSDVGGISGTVTWLP